MDQKKHFQTLLANNRIDQLIRELLEALEQHKQGDLQENVLLLSSRYRHLEDKFRKNLLSNAEYNLEFNKIIHALKDYLNEYEPRKDQGGIQPEPSASISRRKGMSTANWIALGSLAVAALTCYLTFFREAGIRKPETVPSTTPTTVPTAERTMENTNVAGSGKPSARRPAPGISTLLQVDATPAEYRDYFRAQMSELLQSEKVAHIQGEAKNFTHRIECAFEVQKAKTQSGMREAFRYSLSLKVNVWDKNGQNCFTGFYTSGEPRIGYPEDNAATLRKKIIGPCLAEVKAAVHNNPPRLCK